MERTRKEILDDISRSLESPLDVGPVEVNINGPDFSGISESLESHGKSVKSAGIMSIAAAAISASVEINRQDREQVKDFLGATFMLPAIERLLEEDDKLTYDKAIKRSYVPNSTCDDRITFLNSLIQVHQVVDVECIDGVDYLSVDYDPEYYDAYIDGVEETIKELERIGYTIHRA